MKINIRFGMYRETEILHREKRLYDGIVMPAHILAYQPSAASVFVTSLPTHPYIIDPMTQLLQVVYEEELRASVRSMCEEYHPDLIAQIETAIDGSALRPDDIPEISEFCQGVVDFQRRTVPSQSQTPKAAKYIKRKGFGGAHVGAPRALVSPYFRFRSIDDEWFDYWRRCIEQTRRLIQESDKFAAVVHCPAAILDGRAIQALSQVLEGVQGVFLWMDDFNESAVSPTDIIRTRHLVRSLTERDKSVEFLYGGYLGILMHYDGLEQLSHGILYTQHRSSESVPGAGGVPERYYIPAFHAFRSLSQTDLIFHKHPELMCECQICKSIFNGNPDNIIQFADNPELLRSHFLAVRRAEANLIERKSIEDALEELKATYERYHSSISALPNPDAFASRAKMSGLEYLQSWRTAFSN